MRQGRGGSAGAGLRRCLSSQGTSHARPCPLSVDAVGSDALRRREHVFGALAYSRVSLYYKDRAGGPGSTAGKKPSMASVSLCNLVPCLLRVDVNVPEHSTQQHKCARRTMATSHADGVFTDEPSFLAGSRSGEASVELPEPPQTTCEGRAHAGDYGSGQSAGGRQRPLHACMMCTLFCASRQSLQWAWFRPTSPLAAMRFLLMVFDS